MPTLSLEDGTLWYEIRGNGPPLVCLHGGWQNADSWRPQIDRFAREYSVITYDLRGHGRTGATGSRRYSVDQFADDLERLLDHLDIERPILFGISIGGMVIQSYLDRHPDGAFAAVIGGPLRSMSPVEFPSALKPLVSPLPAITWMVSTIGPTLTFQSLLNMIRGTTGKPWITIHSTVRSQVMAAVREVAREEFLKIFRALYEFVPPNLSHVRTPTLALYGDHEAPPIKRQGEQLAKTIPRGVCREISDSGHLVNQDNPRSFNEACTEFLASSIRSTPP